MKLISIITPCYNEEDNIENLYKKVKQVFSEMPGYAYEHIFIDNDSKDSSSGILKKIAAADKNVKVILNIKNFGHIRSPYYAFLQSKGDAAAMLACDFQDPPELIKEFISKWEAGNKIVIGVKKQSRENPVMFAIRKLYYNIMERLSETEQIKNFTGFGLYDKKFVDILRSLDEPYPYFRGLVSELGFAVTTVEYVQPKREKGKTKNNLYVLYDMAMLGIVSYSKIPLRMSAFVGFILGFVSLSVAIAYFVYKIIYWKNFQVGMAPIVIGLFFFSAVQLFFIGIIGEYIGTIFTHVKKKPLVVEKERINF
ncbi:MAG: dolichol monophosphate mannose synthase [Elusimicrobia bacterium RIFOXYB1_FULL_48_9]|nr:MAG: dolichol monophosphate mannose synthase [Elusimicrobia bacterium RIFOXYB1_FULL_48_9]